MIQCQNIYKSYDTKTVLNGIDFTIPDGEIFGLLGPSGIGVFVGRMREQAENNKMEQALDKYRKKSGEL